jgi:riboflavin biosynthesis pyrimidine reductase
MVHRAVAGEQQFLHESAVAAHEGEIEIAGPHLAGSLTGAGLIDEYRIYLHPVVLGQGTPYFAGPRPPLRLTAHDRIDDDVVRLTYVPA